MTQRKQAYENGEIIYREGEPADGAYEILSGAVELLRDDTTGTFGETSDGTFHAGQMFGEMGLVGDGARESTARALGSVQLRLIQRDQAPGQAQPTVPKKGILGRLIEKISSPVAQPQPQPQAPAIEAPKHKDPGFIQRMIEWMHPPKGRIEARVALFSGDHNGQITKQVIAAFDRFRDVHARPMGRTLEINADEDLTTELARVAKLSRHWLTERQADILIWGHVPPPGNSVHIHFISRATWDERVPGGFDLTTDLPLSTHLPGSFSDFLHAATLSATVPASREKAKMRLSALPDATVAAGISMDDIPPDLTTRERAALYLCHGNILSAAWSATRQPEFFDNAVTAYRHVSATVKMDESPLDWAMAHKHLSNLLYLRADINRDKPGYEESATAARSALEVFTKNETPGEWAAMQHRLGLIHYNLGYEAGQTDILRQSLDCHQNALKVYSKRLTTAHWAEAMSSFARTAQVFGEHVKSLEAITTAANAYHAVLQVRDREQAPLAWAATQNNLGSALFLLGKKTRKPERIEAAIDAFEAALEVYQLHGKHQPETVTRKNLDHAQNLLKHISPKHYLSRGLLELDGPFSEDYESQLVDVSDIGADVSDGSTIH